MSRWHQRLKDLQCQSLPQALSSASPVQNVQNVQNDMDGGANSDKEGTFERFERFEQASIAEPKEDDSKDLASIDYDYEERAAIMEFDGGLSREEAERASLLYTITTHYAYIMEQFYREYQRGEIDLTEAYAFIKNLKGNKGYEGDVISINKEDLLFYWFSKNCPNVKREIDAWLKEQNEDQATEVKVIDCY